MAGVRWLGAGLGAAAVLASAGAVVATTAVHWSFTDALNAFVVSNLVIGVSFALCGALIAWHRPRLLLGWLWTLSEVRWVLSVLIGLACMVFRYRRGNEVARRQLLWLVLAAAVIVVAVTPWALVAGTPLLVLFTIPLLPAAVAVAVLRHGLFDIKLVVSRVVTYALLSGLVLAAYAGLVVVL